MQISDRINVTLCILSFILAVISLATVIITLVQNHKMIENSTRPYISLYSNITCFKSVKYYLILKNYGQTGALIKEFKCNIDLLKYCPFIKKRRPFEHIIGTLVAPQQSYVVCIDPVKLSNDKIEMIEFNIKYSSGIKDYDENYKINFLADTDSGLSRANTKDKELQIISYTLQDMVEKLL